jgi:hypothetical protein
MAKHQLDPRIVSNVRRVTKQAQKQLGPMTQDKLVYSGFALLFVTVVMVNGFEACWASMTGQFVAATNVYPVAFTSTTKTASLADSPIVATSFTPEEEAPTGSSCKINLDGYNQIGEQTTEGGKSFKLYNKDKIIIVPKDNPDSGNVVLMSKAGGLTIRACGSLTEQGLLIGNGKDATKLNLGEKDDEGKFKIFKVKVKKASSKKSEPTIVTVL